ncbi:PREDICTED: guanylin [Galeopterus variegatus]|uniref:Guanylin n=1 Tax=Galeopterus variegatus TaxID=482537 RepID=A0ABM0RL42_GALVR|nr:PREDICTED: guanylin [Galeopterus variegatus]
MRTPRTSCSPLLGAIATNTLLLSSLCLVGAWVALAGEVTVRDGDFSFSLESVKKLKGLRELQEPRIGKFRELEPMPFTSAVPILCSNPKFPEELKPICKEPNAQGILQRLGAIAEHPILCEICAYAACAGC